MMDKFVESVKQIALNAVSAAKPVEVCFGTVVEISPFSVRLDQKLILTKEYFIIGKRMENTEWETGDILILERLQGGQKYLIIDRKGDF